MKSIIVGTDFSKGSYVALEIAVDIANQLHTGIRLLWVKKEKKLLSGEQMEMTAHLAEEKLDALCQQHQPNLRHGTITSAILSGKVATCIAEEAVREEAPMIVIGTNGASGFEKYWMGSTAVRIVQEAPCPTLTIREGYNGAGPSGAGFFSLFMALTTPNRHSAMMMKLMMVEISTP